MPSGSSARLRIIPTKSDKTHSCWVQRWPEKGVVKRTPSVLKSPVERGHRQKELCVDMADGKVCRGRRERRLLMMAADRLGLTPMMARFSRWADEMLPVKRGSNSKC